MRISTNWIKDYVDLKNEDLKVVADKVTNAGVNIEGIESFDFSSLVVGEILEVKAHPDSDHLHICKVDVKTEILEIVCGAPNVKEHLKVIVALVGAVLPGNFEIKPSIIRGVASSGMICALFELGLESKEENYDKGIHELPADAKVGDLIHSYLGLDDTIYTLDLNPNRNDCLSHIGFAYEVAAVLEKKVTLPDTSIHPIEKSLHDYIKVNVETENCPFYTMKMVEDVHITSSPDFLKQRLQNAGMRSINNVVDISNYVMLEYGQPLHFFDYDKLEGQLTVRMAKDQEQVTTLDKKERSLLGSDIVISDSKGVTCIAGVMGGIDAEVDENTNRIVIESAIFDPALVRRTSIRLDLRSEASLRYEKGLDKEYTLEALNRACHLLEKYASAKTLSDTIIYDHLEDKIKTASVTKTRINAILGMTLTDTDIERSFHALGFPFTKENETFTVTIPNRRMDVAIREDLIEEVGRLYGYDKMPSKLPTVPILKGGYSKTTNYRKEISKRMRSLGLDEVRTYTLISEEENTTFSYQQKESITLLNPMSNDKKIVRQTLIPSLLKVVDYNISHSVKDILIYEISNTYYQDQEEMKLGFALTGDYMGNQWLQKVPVDFYLVKGIVENILTFLGFKKRYQFIPKQDLKDMHPFQSVEVYVDQEPIGYFGKVHPNVRKETYVGEINLSKLQMKKTRSICYPEISKYPVVKKDVSFIVDRNITSAVIEKIIQKTAGKILKKIDVFDLYQGEKVEIGKKAIAYSLLFQDDQKTLTEEEISSIFNKIIEAVVVKVPAELRDK